MAEPVREFSGTAAGAPAVASKSIVREYAEALLFALGLAVVLRTFLIQAYKIPSGSMEQTLLIGDHIIVNKLVYGLRMPDSIFGLTPFEDRIPYGKYLLQLEPVHRGDVIVFVPPQDPTKDFIKRVVGVPGDTVEVKDGQLYLNGELAQPPPGTHYEVPPDQRDSSQRDSMEPMRLQQGQYFMMGDNRDRSYDSRFWGPITRDAVEGRAMFIYWSCGGGEDSSPLRCLYDVRWTRLFHGVR